MKLSIIVPVYNEEKSISEVLKQLIKIRLGCNKEIIVVNDGSTDDTDKKIKYITEYYHNKNIKIVNHKVNLGKGAAVKSGLKKASGDYVLIQDADMEYQPAEIPELLSPVLNKKVNDNSIRIAVYGSRFSKYHAIIPPLYYLGNKLLTTITNIIYNINLTDMETGYKLIPYSFFKENKIESKHFDIEPEITAKLIKNNIKIIEVPISYKGRNRLAGKKLTILDAIEALKTILYYRFS